MSVRRRKDGNNFLKGGQHFLELRAVHGKPDSNAVYVKREEELTHFFSLAFPSALTLGTSGDLPGIVTWRAFTTPGTGAPITGPP